ncbi:SAM-dependent methyltransferase [Actinoallomurus acanthiterrae]
MAQGHRVPSGVDTTVPSVARMYDYFLGGKDNFAIDRQAADNVIAALPDMPFMVRENRRYLNRAVRFLAGEAGMRQFLDIGAGLPTQGNVHTVAQAVAPEARVVYIDNDPMVVTHGRALLSDDERVHAVQADLRHPGKILEIAHTFLDFTRPVALLLIAVLHFIPDEENPWAVVARLRDALPTGSHLAISHVTGDYHREATSAAAEVYRDQTNARMVFRRYDDVLRFFDGFELLEPGVTTKSLWRPDAPGFLPHGADEQWGYAGVAVKR